MIKKLLNDYMSNVLHLEMRKNIRLKLTGEDYIPACVAVWSDMPMCHSGQSTTESAAIKRVDRDVQVLIIDDMIEYIESEIRVVDSLIATLDRERDQIIIKLRWFSKKSYEAIADELSCEKESIERAYHRAMHKMSKEYNKYNN